MTEYRKVKLTSLCDPKQWPTIARDKMSDSGYPVYGANGIIGYYHEFNHLEPTIMIGCRGTCGTVNISKPKSYITGNAMSLDNLSDEANQKFLYHQLLAYDFGKIITGSSQPQITQAGLHQVWIKLHGLDLQQSIAHTLDVILDLIALHNEVLEAIDQLVKSRFDALFGDCNETVEIGNSGMTISDGNYSSKYPRREEFVDDGVPFIRANNLINGTVNDSDMYYITVKKHQELVKGHVKKGDVLITTRGRIGRISVVPERHNDSNINAQIVLLRCEGSVFEPQYLLESLRSEDVQRQFLELQTGTALKQLPVGKLKMVKIPKPRLEVQKQFSAFINQTDKSKFAIQQSLAELETLKKALMQQYFG